ncbi:TPA: reverse transcriptase family protein [Klebsiella oxytoca]|uniref:reverse transcriptase family protein n=1 Tax=Klebsiella pneumoniae TaxID=573 RepID=UPI0015E9A3B2|nr:reverse transcriptase family protein [Klebsiella pneumoniae]QMF81497.1 RNA-directed DNA polymerase [Klebsiella pneumoniae]
MKNKRILIDKVFYERFLSVDSFKENLISQIPIPKITNKEVRLISSGAKTFYAINNTSPHSHVQYRLNRYFFSHIPINSAAKAFVKGGSYLKYLEPHIYGSSFCRLDISSFFNNISFNDVEMCLSPYIKDEYLIGNEQKLLSAILNSIGYEIPIHKKHTLIVPMGFKTSPIISNIVFRKMDLLIQNFCAKKGIIYSRYADDMLFSNPKESKLLISDYFFDEISSLLSIMGFKINESKYIAREKEISINGYVIENKGGYGAVGTIRLSKSKLKTILKVIHGLNENMPHKSICNKYIDIRLSESDFKYENKKAEFEKKYYRDQLINYLSGYRAYILSLIKFNIEYRCVNNHFLSQISAMLDDIQKHIIKEKNKRLR